MKKISVLVAITMLLTTLAFAETSIPVVEGASPVDVSATTVSPPDANDILDNSEEVITSPITDIDPTTEGESVLIDDNFKAVPKTDHDEDATYHYTIDATYPQISGNNLTQAAQQFNQMIQKMVTEQINQFKNNVKFDANHMNTLPEDMRNNSFKIDYDIDVIKPDNELSIVSVRLSMEGMQAGRPHPFHAHEVLNFDLTHGKELALNELFKKNANYLKIIAKYSNNKLNETLQDKWLIASGTEPNAKNYKNWNLQDDSLLITFDEYQVAPYVDGPQEVEIPLSELSHLFITTAPVMAEFKTPILNSATSATKHLAKTQSKTIEKIAATQVTNNKTKTLG